MKHYPNHMSTFEQDLTLAIANPVAFRRLSMIQ